MSTALVQSIGNDGYETATWASLDSGETGIKANVGKIAGIKTIQFSGTFSTATLTIQGSLDGTNWFTMKAIDLTTGDYTPLATLGAADLTVLVENPRFVRPVVTASGSPDIKVIVGGQTRI